MKIFICLLFISQSVWAKNLSIMTFNTMCDFCKGSEINEFDQRLQKIKELVVSHRADLISLQELRSVSQVKEIIKDLPDHKFIASDYFLGSYADPAILYNSKKLKLLKHDQFWLGPNEGRFSLGWKFSLPRQVHWAKFEYEKEEFIFLSTHLDNRLENLAGSASLIRTFLSQFKIPVIIAADTNMTVDMPEYKTLTHERFDNAFDIKKTFKVTGDYQDDRDLCYLRKGKKFPECRVDHILLSKESPYKVEEFIIDSSRNFKDKFASDHRPVIINLSH